MVWVKLDDKLHSNAKILDVGYEGAGLYALGLSYCGDHLTDGHIPDSWAKQHPKRLRDKLVKARLWQRTKTGYYVPDFTELNPTRAEIEAKRARQREGGRKGANTRWTQPSGENRSTHGLTHRYTHVESHGPDPTPKNNVEEDQHQPSREPPPRVCPICGVKERPGRPTDEHLTNVHWLEGKDLEKALEAATRAA